MSTHAYLLSHPLLCPQLPSADLSLPAELHLLSDPCHSRPADFGWELCWVGAESPKHQLLHVTNGPGWKGAQRQGQHPTWTSLFLACDDGLNCFFRPDLQEEQRFFEVPQFRAIGTHVSLSPASQSTLAEAGGWAEVALARSGNSPCPSANPNPSLPISEPN